MGEIDWKFRRRTYPHFDHVINSEEEALELIHNFQESGKHTFLPFLESPIELRRFTKHLEKIRLEEAGEDSSAIIVRKPRPIKYASHKDAQIFSYYRSILVSYYEEKLDELGLSENVIAYRKIPTASDPEKGKCNIHFAKEAFDEVVKHEKVMAITLDVKGFFESLDHRFLEQKWRELLGAEELPKDHKAVFSAITHYSVVDQVSCYENLGLIRIDKKNKKKYLHCPFFISKHRKMLCDKKEYREKIFGKGLVKKNNKKGIPQGSPISDILANLYMLDFDIEMAALAKEKNAYYRRYSDDILWICSPEDASNIEDQTKKSLHKQGKQTLTIGDDKTTRTTFIKNGDSMSYSGDHFSYLGFSFDGKKALYREKTISKYKRDAVFSIQSFVRRANDQSVGNELKGVKGNDKSLKENLNVSQIYHKVGYLNKDYINKKRKEKWEQPRNKSKQVEGNFMTYHLRSLKIFNNTEHSLYSLSDQQLRNYKEFIRKRIIEEARKYDSSFSIE